MEKTNFGLIYLLEKNESLLDELVEQAEENDMGY